MGFREGAKAAIAAVTPSRGSAVTELQAALTGPGPTIVPAPTLASPWYASNHLGNVVWSDLFGTEDLPITRAEAMAIPAVARARNVVATTLGRLPIRAGRLMVDADGAETFTPHALQPTVLVQPDTAQARYVTLTWLVDDLIFEGLSWLLTTEWLTSGHPNHVRRIHPGGVQVDGRGTVRVYGEVVDPARVIRVDGPHEGVLNFGGRTLRMARALERSAARFARNPVPAIELHQTDDRKMSPGEISELISAWARAREGENGGVAYTSRNIEAKPHGLPAEHLLTSGRNAQAIDAARVIGVPADVVDATPEEASLRYTNVEMRGRNLIDYGLAAYAAAVEGRLSMDDVLPHGTTVRWDLSSITAPSTSAADTPPPPSGGVTQ